MPETVEDEIELLLHHPEIIDWLGLSESEIARRRARRAARERRAAEVSTSPAEQVTVAPPASGAG